MARREKGNTKLQKLLNEKNVTQAWLYDKIKEQCHTPVGEYQINRICKGKAKNYQLITLVKICKALEVTPNEIISKSDFDHLFKGE
jgi:DNA-binding Xre family transcriptional regulator